MKTINDLADFIAPRAGYRGGAWKDDSEEIPEKAIVWCAVAVFVVVLVLHILRTHAGA